MLVCQIATHAGLNGPEANTGYQLLRAGLITSYRDLRWLSIDVKKASGERELVKSETQCTEPYNGRCRGQQCVAQCRGGAEKTVSTAWKMNWRCGADRRHLHELCAAPEMSAA
jgi:hypothetical protein